MKKMSVKSYVKKMGMMKGRKHPMASDDINKPIKDGMKKPGKSKSY